MKQHKIVLVGCGGMANVWIKYAIQRENAEIVGLVDIRLESALAMKERYGLQVPVFTDLKSALTQTPANLVFDVTIPESHRDVASTALQYGCSVFGEKPLATEMDHAREMVALSERTGKLYAVMQNRRYLSKIRTLRDSVAAGMIGTVNTVNADFYIGAHFGGFRDVMDHPLILDMAIHTFDQARFITGADPVSVYCHEYNPPGSWFKGNASAICIFEMNNGSVFTYRGSWCAEGLSTSWESTWRMIGSKGTMQWDGSNDPVCEIVDSSQPTGFHSAVKRVDLPVTWEGREGHNGCLDEMFSALEDGRLAETVCSDNIKSLAMVFGAIESAQKSCKIHL